MSADFKGVMKMRKPVLSYVKSGLFASDLCGPRRWNKFAIDLRTAKWSSLISQQASATGLQRSQNEWSTELFSWPLVTPGESFQLSTGIWISPDWLVHPFVFQLAKRQVCAYCCKVYRLISLIQREKRRHFCIRIARKDIFSPVPCVLREHWHYLLWRSPCCSSLCLCFHLDNSCGYMGSRHWQEDHQNKESLQLHSKHTSTSQHAANHWLILKDWLQRWIWCPILVWGPSAEAAMVVWTVFFFWSSTSFYLFFLLLLLFRYHRRMRKEEQNEGEKRQACLALSINLLVRHLCLLPLWGQLWPSALWRHLSLGSAGEPKQQRQSSLG